MINEKVSTSLTIIRGGSPRDIARRKRRNRAEFVAACEASEDVRTPAREDLDRWFGGANEDQANGPALELQETAGGGQR